MLIKLFYSFLIFLLLWFLLDLFFGRKEKYGITFIAGEIGSGKSTLATKYARQHLKKGWTVYSNTFIDGCNKLDVSMLNSKCCPPKSLLIIDEASLDMNSRNFSKMKIEMIEYFKKSRHYKNKIIMISQTFGDTDKQIRELSSKVLFVRILINGLVSMPVNVKGKLGIGQDGQPCVMYSIGKIGLPYFLPKWRKYFNSFEPVQRPIINLGCWSKSKENSQSL